LSGSVQKFDIANKSFSTFADNISGINGVSVNPFNDDVYVLKSPDATTAGEVDIYGSDKQKKKTITAGLSPYWVIFETIK
ncbi:MAG: hypothetical protein PUG15_06185, partial [Bacteroidales bacterium]|nr:hypothetical protein [Bacteroidales bacterium]